jgi:cyclopropane fatty-acyl-phospholipid synthase-like methyltransferase
MTDKIFADWAERNKAPIADVMAEFLPETGEVLEIASGSGQHVVHFAERFASLNWQPTDLQDDRVASINAYRADTGCHNIHPARKWDARQAGTDWANGSYQAVVIVNVFHLISTPDTRAIIRNAAQALAPGGMLFIYGPFMRGGELTSTGDQDFDQRIRSETPDAGYKDDFDMIDWIQEEWLDMRLVAEMPANNLMLVAAKP